MVYIEGSHLREVLSSDAPKIVLYVVSDINDHPVYNSIACLYIKTAVGEYFSSFNHPDYPQTSAENLVVNNALTTDIKSLLNLGVEVKNSYDLLYTMNAIEPSSLSRFYKAKLAGVKDINRIVPLYNHLETMKNVADGLDLNVPPNSRYLGMYHDRMPRVFSSMERRGVPVCPELFTQYFGVDKKNLVRENRIYTSYNFYTSTGRPSNSHGGINYAALNKSDGSRKAFQSSGTLINIDFNSYHLHLIIKRLKNVQDFGPDIHDWLGKQYFNTTQLTDEQRAESKRITFKNLYGYHMDDIVKDIDLFKDISILQNNMWEEYQSRGHLLTEYNNRIVVDGATKNKVFNYHIQSLETEANVIQLRSLIDSGLTPILYTYDSMVFEIDSKHPDDVTEVIGKIENVLMFPYSTQIGTDLDF